MATVKVARRKMTAEEAQSFGRFSIGNAMTVKMSRPCGCEPYKDVFTFKRWIAQGFCVKKGEKAIRLAMVKEVEDKENSEKVRRVLGSSAVFCRHQVAPLGEPRKVEPSPVPVRQVKWSDEEIADELAWYENERLERIAADMPPIAERAAEQYKGWKRPATPQVEAMPGWTPLGARITHDSGTKVRCPDCRNILPGSPGAIPGHDCTPEPKAQRILTDDEISARRVELAEEPTVKALTLEGQEVDTFATEREHNGISETQGRMI